MITFSILLLVLRHHIWIHNLSCNICRSIAHVLSCRLYLDQDVALSEETVHKYSDCVLTRFNTTVTELRRLFLVEDLVDSLKVSVYATEDLRM